MVICVTDIALTDVSIVMVWSCLAVRCCYCVAAFWCVTVLYFYRYGVDCFGYCYVHFV